ncbi:DUF2062 domain-containing protein [Thermodesulfobacteriota bacterium]
MKLDRRLRYYYLRFIRLRGEPHELALGMAFGALTGMMPILPFQSVTAIALAVFFKASKITAALGTWISNPLNWYLLYFYNYKLGVYLLGLKADNSAFASIMNSIKTNEEALVIAGKILHAGGTMVAAFLIGGLVMGAITAPPTYYIFLYIFKRLRAWRRSKKKALEPAGSGQQ